MKKFKTILLTLPVVSLFVLGMFTSYAYARDGSDDSGNTSSSSGSSDSGGLSGHDSGSDDGQVAQTTGSEAAETENEADSTQTTEAEDSAKAEAKDLLQTLRKDHKEHTALERKRNCQAAEHGLENKLGNLQRNAVKFQSRIDKVFAKAQSYQATNNIQVSNWDQLVAAAQAAQTKAASSVTALNNLSVNLDCSSGSVAENVATFKTAAKQARTDLLAYKSAVKDILTALAAAKDQTEGGSNETTQ